MIAFYGCMLGATLLAIACSVLSADVPLVKVRLESGRAFSGVVDQRTSDKHLWIRLTYGNAVVLRPIQWQRISAVQTAEKEYKAAEFRLLAERLKQEGPAGLWPTNSSSPSTLLLLPYRPTVRSLHAQAHLANWDTDAAPDGIDLCVAPLCDGQMVPVEGVLEVTAKGYEQIPGEPVDRWSILARWSEPLSLACYGPEGGVLRLPFRSVPLDLRRVVGKRVWLCLRLTVPAHGAFEAEIMMTP